MFLLHINFLYIWCGNCNLVSGCLDVNITQPVARWYLLISVQSRAIIYHVIDVMNIIAIGRQFPVVCVFFLIKCVLLFSLMFLCLVFLGKDKINWWKIITHKLILHLILLWSSCSYWSEYHYPWKSEKFHAFFFCSKPWPWTKCCFSGKGCKFTCILIGLTPFQNLGSDLHFEVNTIFLDKSHLPAVIHLQKGKAILQKASYIC